jgi:hypothetical protein
MKEERDGRKEVKERPAGDRKESLLNMHLSGM